MLNYTKCASVDGKWECGDGRRNTTHSFRFICYVSVGTSTFAMRNFSPIFLSKISSLSVREPCTKHDRLTSSIFGPQFQLQMLSFKSQNSSCGFFFLKITLWSKVLVQKPRTSQLVTQNSLLLRSLNIHYFVYRSQLLNPVLTQTNPIYITFFFFWSALQPM